MEHQDWNNITFSNQSAKIKQQQYNKALSQKPTSQDVKIEAPSNLGKLISNESKTRQRVATSLGVL